MSVAKFISHYGIEAAALGRALGALLDGVALPAKARDDVQSAVEIFVSASEAIAKAVEADKVVPTVKISKADIAAIVKDELASMVKEAVAEYMANNSSNQDDGK